MSPTLELVLEQVRSLSESEQAELARILANPTTERRDTVEERLAKIKAFRGKYRGILPSTEEFMAEKRLEVELEEQKWRR